MVNEFRRIYDRLSDERSKEIFEKRLMFSLTGDDVFALSLGKEYEKMVMISEEWKCLHKRLKAAGDKIALYSAGYWGRELILRTEDVPWRYVIDIKPKADEFVGIPLISLNEFDGIKEDYTIVISSRVYFEEIYDQLLNLGISKENIIDGTVLFDMSEGRQYFDLPYLPRAIDGEVFADVGSYDGLSTVLFDKWCKGDGFAYCFEPDKTNIERVHRVLKKKNVTSYELIDKGVWSRPGHLGFASTGNSVSHIMESEETSSIDVVALDDVLLDKNVTFIKMDIEGSELEALKGAERIIKEQKPKLAICVYHKPQDIWEVPKLILDYNPSYRFYLRHYSYKDNETVLYAI